MRKARNSATSNVHEVEANFVLATPAFAPTDSYGHREFYVRRSKPVDGMQGYLLCKSLKFEPLIIGWSVSVPKLNGAQVVALEKALDDRLSAEEVDWIDAALEQFVKAIVLADRIIKPKDMMAKVRECQALLLSVKRLISVLNPEEDDSLRRDHVSADAMVGLLFGGTAQESLPSMIVVDQMLARCDELLKELEAKSSKRGAKKDLALNAFLQSMVTISEFSGLRTALPSNSFKERFADKKPTVLSRLAKQLLQIANELGIVALKGAKLLTPAEKQRASRAFTSYARTSDGAVIDRLREVRRDDFAYPRGRFNRAVWIDTDDLNGYAQNKVLTRDGDTLLVGTKRP